MILSLKENIKSFLKPTVLKAAILIAILIYVYQYISNQSPGSSYLIYSLLIDYPVKLKITDFLYLFIIFPYGYMIACSISALFGIVKTNKILSVILLITLLFLIGVDEPLINSTVNKPNYSCAVDSDCMPKSISKDICSSNVCLNKNWTYYNSRINSAFATMCISYNITCSCTENKCKTQANEI